MTLPRSAPSCAVCRGPSGTSLGLMDKGQQRATSGMMTRRRIAVDGRCNYCCTTTTARYEYDLLQSRYVHLYTGSNCTQAQRRHWQTDRIQVRTEMQRLESYRLHGTSRAHIREEREKEREERERRRGKREVCAVWPGVGIHSSRRLPKLKAIVPCVQSISQRESRVGSLHVGRTSHDGFIMSVTRLFSPRESQGASKTPFLRCSGRCFAHHRGKRARAEP